MPDLTTILPTSRAVRAQILQHTQKDSFLPRYLTMGEFLQRAIIADGYRRVDDDTRTLLLLDAADFDNFKNLQIERNFFTFTQNATYLFRFFEELSGELIDISALEYSDTYGDYEEHIRILQELYRRYEMICNEKRVLDPIFLPKLGRLNSPYVKSLGSIELVAEGYLTNFEMKTLIDCAEQIPLSLYFYASRFNTKMQDKLSNLGIAIMQNKHQKIDLSNLKVTQSSALNSDAIITCESFGERLLQVAFIKQQVFDFINSGIEPEHIAVVLPDEDFALHLRRFDSENNFNFAMGVSLNESTFVKMLVAVMDYLDNQSVENMARLNRIGPELLQSVSPQYKAKVETCDFNGIINIFLAEEADNTVKDIVIEELFYFEKILPALAGTTLKSALFLFLNRIKTKTIDDVRGGKITVMGVLETRSVQYDGVIVVDFNENRVPHKSEKDLFLNSTIRIKAGLPGARDRESLQKLYYSNLFLRAKKVAISYVESADAVPSRFLTQLGITASKNYEDAQWADILFDKEHRLRYQSGEIEGEYDFTKHPLSATGLKTFLTCKRKFYHHYVEGLREHEIAKDMPEEHEIGTALHDALRDVYLERSRFTDKEELKQAVSMALKENNGTTIMDSYLHKLWLRRLDPFFEAEIRRFKETVVTGCEENLTAQVRGIVLTGQVDRIDLTPDGLEVLDYKSGKYPVYTARTVEKATDFQLEFYYLLAKQKGDVKGCGYYDLKSGSIIPETLLEIKLQVLYDYLQELRETTHFNFSQTEDFAACRYCPFAHLCQREL